MHIGVESDAVPAMDCLHTVSSPSGATTRSTSHTRTAWAAEKMRTVLLQPVAPAALPRSLVSPAGRSCEMARPGSSRTKRRHLGQLVSALEVLGHDRGVRAQRCR